MFDSQAAYWFDLLFNRPGSVDEVKMIALLRSKFLSEIHQAKLGETTSVWLEMMLVKDLEISNKAWVFWVQEIQPDLTDAEVLPILSALLVADIVGNRTAGARQQLLVLLMRDPMFAEIRFLASR